MRRLPLAVALAVAAPLAAPAASHAVIQVQRGISGVALGMSQDQVRAALGSPVVRHGRNEFGPYTTFRYAHLGITVAFHGDTRVTSVDTTGVGDRTASGVGVGSTPAVVRARVPGVRCATEAGFHHCQVGRSLPGRRVTDFLFSGGRVSRVLVGFVID